MTEDYPLLQSPEQYRDISRLFINYLRSIEHPEELQEKLLQGFYIYHRAEKLKLDLKPEEELELDSSWGTPYSVKRSVFIQRMRARATPQFLLWINSQIYGNNLAADTYLTLLGIEFYKSHGPKEPMSMKWLDDIEIRGKSSSNEILYKFSRALCIRVDPNPELSKYYWDAINRTDLYIFKGQ